METSNVVTPAQSNLTPEMLVMSQLTTLQSTVSRIETNVTEVRSDLRETNIKLWGESTSENAQGRMPRLEATVEKHESELDNLKRTAIRDGQTRIEKVETNVARFAVYGSLITLILSAAVTTLITHFLR